MPDCQKATRKPDVRLANTLRRWGGQPRRRVRNHCVLVLRATCHRPDLVNKPLRTSEYDHRPTTLSGGDHNYLYDFAHARKQ